jgi:hypothetical protein
LGNLSNRHKKDYAVPEPETNKTASAIIEEKADAHALLAAAKTKHQTKLTKTKTNIVSLLWFK